MIVSRCPSVTESCCIGTEWGFSEDWEDRVVTEVCPPPPPPAMRSRTLMKKGKLIGFPEFRGIVLLTSLTSLRELNYMYLFVIIVKLPFFSFGLFRNWITSLICECYSYPFDQDNILSIKSKFFSQRLRVLVLEIYLLISEKKLSPFNWSNHEHPQCLALRQKRSLKSPMTVWANFPPSSLCSAS